MSTPRDELDAALMRMVDAGTRPRCVEPADTHLWTSDDRDDRARAAALCAGCAVVDLCAASAEWEDDEWHVRGGVDRRPAPRRQTRKSA